MLAPVRFWLAQGAEDDQAPFWFLRSPVRPEFVGPYPRFDRVFIVTSDGGYRVMDSNSGSIENEGLAECFSRLWETGLSVPDVFAFLSSRPAVAPEDRLEVLLEDQHQRWLRGQPLPLRVYLSAFPDIAERGELIRAWSTGSVKNAGGLPFV